MEQCHLPRHHQGELDPQHRVLVLLLPVAYRFNNHRPGIGAVSARGLDLLSAFYASQRLPLPLRGVLLVGY